MDEEKPLLLLGDLAGPDGNAFVILGRAMAAAKAAGWPKDRIAAVLADAKSGDYDHLLDVIVEHFDAREDRHDYVPLKREKR